MPKKLIALGIIISFCVGFMFAQEAGNNIRFYSSSGGSTVSATSSTLLKTLSALTLEAWIKPSTGGEWALIMGKQNNSSDANPWYSYRLCKNSNNSSDDSWPDQVVFSIAPSNGGNEVGVSSTKTVGNNVWTHVAGVYDGSSMKIYINGQLDGTYAYSGGIHESDLPFYIGHAPWTNYNNFDGYMDELRVWNVARTETQIKDNMHKTLEGNETGLIAYWQFNDDPSSSTTDDASMNAHTGTLSGSATIVNNSAVPVGYAGDVVETNLQTGVGGSNAQVKVTISSTPDSANFLGIYQYGSAADSVTGETFPAGIERRSDVIWGIVERGSVTADIVLEYGAMLALGHEDSLRVLKRTDATGAWSDVTSEFTQNTSGNTFFKSGETSFSEFAIGASGNIQLVAYTPAGTGTLEDPYQIATWENLYWISVNPSTWDKHFIQTDSIDLSAANPAINTWDLSHGWTPIGNSSTKFTGSYDGQGYGISHLYINRATESYIGLFGKTSGATIKDVHLTNAEVTGSGDVGTLGGRLYASSIEQCSADGSVNGANWVGGLIGLTEGSTVKNCSSSGSVSISGHRAGGLVGYSYSLSIIAECYSSASVTGAWDSENIGGLVGYNTDTSTVTNCYATGSASGYDYVGGLIAVNTHSSTISYCYSTGAVSGRLYSGGLVGRNVEGSTLLYSFWDKETSGQDGGMGKTTAEMHTQSTFDDAGWSFIHKWSIDGGYPYLQQRSDAPIAVAPSVGDGSESSPYEISNLSELYWITQDTARWSLHFIQTADIDAIQTGALIYGWTPIGSSDTKFTGSYDGQGYGIIHLYINRATESYIGLFGKTSGATIKDVHLTNAEVTGSGYVGTLGGRLYASSIEQCSADGSVNGANWAGGLIGLTEGSTVKNCSSSGSVSITGSRVGGLVGYSYSLSTISECYSSATAASTGAGYYVGGFVGINTDTSTIINCYATGEVLDGYENLAGFAASNSNGSIITQCYSTGSVYSSQYTAYEEAFIARNSAEVSKNFFDTETTGRSSSYGATGKTTAEMQTQSTFDDAGWSFIHTWSMDGGYPYLQQRSDAPIAVAPSVGDGSETSPYEISNLSELYWITQDTARWSLHYEQTADIDAIQTGALTYGWVQIGGDHRSFTGSYDGQGFTIDNLYINRGNEKNIGLFGKTIDATIKNIHLTHVEICGNENVGSLGGYIYNSQVDACSSSGSVNGYKDVGGLIGQTSMSLISYCSSSGTVKGSSTRVGGLVGQNYNASIISKCYSTASATSNSSYVGGLIGYNTESSINNSYAMGSAHGYEYIGGLVGRISSTCSVSNCYSTGAVTGFGSYTLRKGLIGDRISGGTVSNSFWDKETSGQTSSDGGTGKTTVEMKTQSTFENAGWDFVSTWLIDNSINLNYPALLWQIDPVSPVITAGTVVDLAKDSARIQYTITETGLPNAFQHGVCWDTTGIPDINCNLTNNGPADSSGVYTSVISGLTPNSFYIARPYIMSAVDTVYGDTLSFITLGAPAISNIAATNIDSNKVTASAEITSLGNPSLTEHGFAWAPDTALSYQRSYLGIPDSTGNVSSVISDLTPLSTYKLFAFAYSAADSVFTDTLSFMTLGLPYVRTRSIVDIDTNQATVYAELEHPGNPTVLQYGVCWSTAINPTTEDGKVELGSSDTAITYNCNIDDLTQNTRYYVRAFASNTLGTVYGDMLDFVTLGNSSISPLTVTDIDTASVKLNAEIFSLGNPTPTGHGFLWAKDDGLNNFNRLHLGAVDSAGIFHTIVSELQPNTNYLALAYVATPGDTMFTDTVGFRTFGYPAVTTLSIDRIRMYTATVSGMINDPGNPTATQHGFCLSTATDPTIEDRKVELGPIDSIAVYSAELDSLLQNTHYFVRAYASNDIGTVYGDTLSFISWGIPSVSEIRISEIDTNKIVANADIISLGNPAASEHGFAWAMDTDSTLTFHNEYLGTPDSIGTFSAVIGSLKPNSMYHIYAFVSNGNDTVHTDTIMTGTYGLPSVSILSLTDIDSISVTASGRIDVIGNPGILQHGFCWSTGVDPTIEDHMVDLGTLDSMVVFHALIDSLTQNTRYYIRAFASNEVGVSYSDTLSFITLETSIYDMIPSEFTLAQNYPNPFNPTTTLQYGLPEVSDVKLIIFDILGRKIKEWSINGQHAGWHKIMWDGSDTGGNTVSTGVYIYSLRAGKFVDTKKMLFMK